MVTQTHPVFKAKRQIKENDIKITMALIHKDKLLAASLQAENRGIRREMLQKYEIIID